MAGRNQDTELAPELRAIAGVKLKLDEPLSRHTSMKIGGPADYFVEVENEPALAAVLRVIQEHGVKISFLGNGSNVLVSDLGVRGAVIHLTGEFKRLEWIDHGETTEVRAGAAVPVTQLVRDAVRRGTAGLEFAEGIPGTVGGALIMNAGAYGSEFERVVDAVDAIDADGAPIHFTRGDMTFSYRDSHMPAGAVVTRVRLRLLRADAGQVSARLRELTRKRKSSQPSGFPNSGSMFRNPPGDFAGRLIEAAGLKGRRIGQVQISERHANFFVNLGGARAEDVHALMRLAMSEVQKQFGIELDPEVRLLGEWPSTKE